MQNYLELMDKLLLSEIPVEIKMKVKDREEDEKEEKLLCGTDGKKLLKGTSADNFSKPIPSVDFLYFKK